MSDVTATKDYFEGVVGQDDVKHKLGFYLKAFDKTHVFPNMLFTAQKGSGKSFMCRKISNCLTLIDNPQEARPLMEINCATIKGPKQLCEQIFMETYGQEVTYFFDEVHMMPPKVTNILLSVLNTTDDNKTWLNYEDLSFEFDLTKVSFLFATTERQALFGPFVDRLTEITLEGYKPLELGHIIRLQTRNTVDFDDDALFELATYCRGNARSAAKMGGKDGVMTYVAANDNQKFTMKDTQELVEILGVYPLGLSRNEVKLLEVLEETGPAALNLLASMADLSVGAQKDTEKLLKKNGLIQVGDLSKRDLTSRGTEYLKKVRAQGRI